MLLLILCVCLCECVCLLGRSVGASAFVGVRINASERQTDSFALIRHSVDDYVRGAKLNT